MLVKFEFDYKEKAKYTILLITKLHGRYNNVDLDHYTV